MYQKQQSRSLSRFRFALFRSRASQGAVGRYKLFLIRHIAMITLIPKLVLLSALFQSEAYPFCMTCLTPCNRKIYSHNDWLLYNGCFAFSGSVSEAKANLAKQRPVLQAAALDRFPLLLLKPPVHDLTLYGIYPILFS